MLIPEPKIRFIASLNNGETIVEGKEPFNYINGEVTPWNRLMRYIAEMKLEITSLSLFTPDGRTFTLPSRGRNPKFKEFADSEKPVDYTIERKLAREQDAVKHADGQIETTGPATLKGHFTVAIAYFPTYKLELWVDELDTRNSWYLVINN